MPGEIHNDARSDHPPALKALDENGRIGGYLVVWSLPAQRDLQGEYFTPETELGLDWYDRRPALYHHGQDAALKSALVGVLDTLRADEIGLWAEAQLERRLRYFRALVQLVKRGALGWSSGSLPQLREVASDGRILRWPIVEGSLTPTPAEPRQTGIQSLKSAYAALGLDSARWLQHAGSSSDNHMKGCNTMSHHLSNGGNGNPTSASVAYQPSSIPQELPQFPQEPARKHLPLTVNAAAPRVGAGMTARKSDELSHSTQTSFGDEWVPNLWSAQVWQQARLSNVILPLFRAIEMPSNPFHLPVEGTDPTVYFVPETTGEGQLALDAAASAIPDSKIGSKKLTLNASKLALRVGFSAELVEDSIVPVLQMFREQALRAIADSIDYTLLNGDTAGASANIN